MQKKRLVWAYWQYKYIFSVLVADFSWVLNLKRSTSCAVYDYTSEDEPWLPKESDDLRGVEGLLFVSQGLS